MKNAPVIGSTRVCIEALIIYTVVFLSGWPAMGAASGAVGADAEFSIAAELTRIFMYSIPSLALIWYLLLRARNLRDWGIHLPGKSDFIAGLISLPCLFLIGLSIAFAASLFGINADDMRLSSPASTLGWVILFISCISTGYLEESFFRFYILSRREALNLSNTSAILFSTIAFAICHIYGGPWFFLNSFLAGIFLCFIFLRYRSLHGIAIAHGLYNFAVYVINHFS
ncbi:MAG: CPBP family intramembrane metalloprotease [Spirochaetes bacterium]|nr:CPBP family intramembrane metalloprotease [Spirochaetota bacterium]